MAIGRTNAYTIIGGGNNFYKCASVDSTNKTWTGYKAVQDSTTGAWSYESTLTTDELTFDKVTPSVNGIYIADATGKIESLYAGFPTAGLTYALKGTSLTASVGESNVSAKEGTLGVTTAGGFSAIKFGDVSQGTYGKIVFNNGTVLTGSAWSMSYSYYKMENNTATNYFEAVFWGYGNGLSVENEGHNNRIKVITERDYTYNSYYYNANFSSGWVNIIITYSDGVFNVYVNGSLVGSDSANLYADGDTRKLGDSVRAYVKDIYFWSRALSASDIAAVFADSGITA